MKPVMKIWSQMEMGAVAIEEISEKIVKSLMLRSKSVKSEDDVLIIFHSNKICAGSRKIIHIETDCSDPILEGHLDIIEVMRGHFPKAKVQAIYRCNGKTELISS